MQQPALWPDEYLFLFSHMRSYSTVLSHVLGSHAEICGYSETHLKYRHSSDLWRLRWRVAKATGGWPRGRYLLDKLLHNFMLIPRDLRQSERLRALIFLRRPDETIRSILRMGEAYPEKSWYRSPVRAAEYYCERIAWLTAIGVHLKDRALLFTSEAITTDTSCLLERISGHLGLRTPLEPKYRLHRFSGVAGHGDASSRLQSGAIISSSHFAGVPVQDIDPDLVERCNRIYDAGMTTLADWCPSHDAPRSGAAEWQSLVA